MFKGPGEGTLKFCGVRAVTGLWEGCGEGLGKKLLGDGAGPELQRSQRGCVCGLWALRGPSLRARRVGYPGRAYLTLELGCELGWPGCGDGWGGGGIDCGVCTCWPGDGDDSMVRLLWLTWKWRGLSLLTGHTLSLLLPVCPLAQAQGPHLHAQPLLSPTASLHTPVPLLGPASQALIQAHAPPHRHTHPHMATKARLGGPCSTAGDPGRTGPSVLGQDAPCPCLMGVGGCGAQGRGGLTASVCAHLCGPHSDGRDHPPCFPEHPHPRSQGKSVLHLVGAQWPLPQPSPARLAQGSSGWTHRSH